MNKFLKIAPWEIIEDGFHPDNQRKAESIFSLGNGRMGHRANFEERYSGDSLQGNYYAGIYYPDKTKVGWWKNGYPEYYAKVINGPNWLGIDIEINGEMLDLHTCEVKNFRRILNMKSAILFREFEVILKNGHHLKISTKRFLSIACPNIGVIYYSVIPVNKASDLKFTIYLDADVKNEDSNYDEKFWEQVSQQQFENEAYLHVKTKKSGFHLCTGMIYRVFVDDVLQKTKPSKSSRDKYVEESFSVSDIQGQEVTIEKYAANISGLYHDKDDLNGRAKEEVRKAAAKGFNVLFEEHEDMWNEKWKHSDIIIHGDVSAQQAVRYNIFQLNQTYTGDDERLNIGPKGFTGEKYGGSTYWDTEAFAFPFYLNTSEQKVAKNLLLYRYKQLSKVIENAEKLGFIDGAALFPMVTMNGEECHNEWEITFEEIHRNGAIAYAMFNYIKHTGDDDYLVQCGLEILIALSRFWSQRISFSEHKKKYVMLGVTGPNEYENNVNNNWYTNKLAAWTLQKTIETIRFVKEKNKVLFDELTEQLKFKEEKETEQWKNIIENLYMPTIEGTNIFLQQDGFLDKENLTIADIKKEERPINQHWSWDRILRSPFIKQADVLQGIFWFEDEYDMDTIRENFNYYEPKTVHESSLSPSIHSILASKIGRVDKAYEFYMRSARLDLDDYNKEVNEGLHITSMAGTWMAVVEGFGGKRIKNATLSFHPVIPDEWSNYAFKILYRKRILKLTVSKQEVKIENLSGEPVNVMLYDKTYAVAHDSPVILPYNSKNSTL
jgi:maltose phosphorylase